MVVAKLQKGCLKWFCFMLWISLLVCLSSEAKTSRLTHRYTDSAQMHNAYFGLIGGLGFSFIGKTQTFLMLADTNNTYDSNRKAQLAWLVGLEAGYNVSSSSAWKWNLGGEVDYLDFGKTKGVVHPLVNAMPDFDILDFSYHAQSYALMARLKLNHWSGPTHFLVWDIAAGIAWNALAEYRETAPANSSAAPMVYTFRSHTTLGPALSAGMGVGFRLTTSSRLIVGYRYFYTGEGHFSAPFLALPNARLSAGILSAHIFYLNLLFA